MANIEVSQWKGANNWALLLDPDGFIAEGTGDNFFIVKDNEIITPEPRNILRGISRAYIFELAQELKFRCVEKNIEPYDVLNADEAFMTGTPFCLLPVTKLNGTPISDAKPGPVSRRLLERWSKNVSVDIAGQIKTWNAKCSNAKSAGSTPYQFQN
jgi:branched-chain amino acid aminotransferase